MPTGDNPRSRANLKPLTTEEARRRGRKGGQKSAEARRAYKSLTEALKDQCTPEVMADITNVLLRRARQGNLKAYELVRDQLGEKPAEKINITQIEPETVSEIEELINGTHEASD